METISKEQQIQQQAETIESLTKQVDRLERELQKCLEPGSDSVAVSTMPLNLTKLEHDDIHELQCRVAYIVAGAFVAIKKDGTSNWIMFSTMREAILKTESCKDFFLDSGFRQAFDALNTIIEESRISGSKYSITDAVDTAHNILGYRDPDAWEKMKMAYSAARLGEKSKWFEHEPGDIQEMKIALEVIIWGMKNYPALLG